MTNQTKPKLSLKSPASGPTKWFAAPASDSAKTTFAKMGLETGPKLPGYSLIRSRDINAEVQKLKIVEGAGKVLAKKGTEDFAEITAEEIERIGTAPVAKPAEIAVPRPPRGGKAGRRWVKREMWKLMVHGERQAA